MAFLPEGQHLIMGLRRAAGGSLLTVLTLWIPLADGPGADVRRPQAHLARDTARICPPAEVRMHTLLEKTIFQVDVLALDVCFGPATDTRLDSIVSGPDIIRGAADSVASVALSATDVEARIEFLRDVGLDRFLEGIRDNLQPARKAGILTDAQYDTISSGLPRWYAFLEGRGIHSGDQMLYRIRGDTLRTVFRAADGSPLLDERYLGPERRLSVLGSYFAPGSDFREGLIRSLLEGTEEG